MNRFVIENTKSTPYIEICYEEQKLSMKGESYPDNAYSFYEPIYKLLESYLLEANKLMVDIQLSYINTSSIKCLIRFFDILNTNYENGKDITIHWYYDEDNGFDYEMGQDFQMDIDIPFEFVSMSSEA